MGCADRAKLLPGWSDWCRAVSHHLSFSGAPLGPACLRFCWHPHPLADSRWAYKASGQLSHLSHVLLLNHISFSFVLLLLFCFYKFSWVFWSSIIWSAQTANLSSWLAGAMWKQTVPQDNNNNKTHFRTHPGHRHPLSSWDHCGEEWFRLTAAPTSLHRSQRLSWMWRRLLWRKGHEAGVGCDALQELSTDGRKLKGDVCLVPHSSHLPRLGRIGPLSRWNTWLV